MMITKKETKMLDYLERVLENMPQDWLGLTTHRLDIYNEELAKAEFLDQFENLYQKEKAETAALRALPTAYDYIRLGHPLSCILEWGIAKLNGLGAESVISFSSQTVPLLAVLRKNLLDGKDTRVFHTGTLPVNFDAEILRNVYGYKFDLIEVDKAEEVTDFRGSTVFISQQDQSSFPALLPAVDFYVNIHQDLGSILLVNGEDNEDYVSDIQHVRRRETIAMTPANCVIALRQLTEQSFTGKTPGDVTADKDLVLNSIKEITGTVLTPLLGSSGLSVQYAIMMGLIDDALENHPGKTIKFIVPPNCYGGTNDQARRVAACLGNVEIVDLPVDGDSDMVRSIDTVLARVGEEDAVPYIIAEIPTNPRVEVPDLGKLREVLTKKRKTAGGADAIDPVFILDQTFCPNVHFLGEGEILSAVRTVSYASGSKFPSGGLCTAGYCVGNERVAALMEKIGLHLELCDNGATPHQVAILAKQLPSMNRRISDAYRNTREFVDFIRETLPGAKINFVSEELAREGFTPSVFSVDLPTKGDTAAEKEAYKRVLNHKLIDLMITKIPEESKYCVSYGQLKGCYWTIPATSTQGTTKEGDKDYIARVSLSPDVDLERHKQVFREFVEEI